MANAILNKETGELREYRQPLPWGKSLPNKKEPSKGVLVASATSATISSYIVSCQCNKSQAGVRAIICQHEQHGRNTLRILTPPALAAVVVVTITEQHHLLHAE